MLNEKRGARQQGDKKIAKTPRYYANFTIQDLVCISMGYTFAFQNPVSIFRKSNATIGVAVAEIGTRPRLTRVQLSRMCTYFIDNAYRVPLPAPWRTDGIKFRTSGWLPFSSFRQILSRIVLRNGILEISVGKKNRYRVQMRNTLRNITGYEIDLDIQC